MTRRFAFVLLCFAACYVPVQETLRPCPCAEGWRCCADENVCVPTNEACRLPFAPNPTLTALKPGDAIDLGVFRCETPADESPGRCHFVVDGATLRYDRRHHRFFMLGGGNTQVDSLFVFDPDTLQWKAVYEPTLCGNRTQANYDEVNAAWRTGPGGGYPRPILNDPQDTFLAMPGVGELGLFRRNGILNLTCTTRVADFSGTVAHFSVDGGTWSFSAAKGDDATGLHSFEWDPLSQQVVSLGQFGLSLYDPRQRTWRQVLSGTDLAGPLAYNQELVYEPQSDRFLYFQAATSKVYALALNRADPVQSTLTERSTSGPFPTGALGFVSTESGGTVVGAVINGTALVFNAETGVFTPTVVGDGGAGASGAHAVAFDPVNGVVVFLTDYVSGYHTWVWRLPAK